jgi:hypothetical protein
MHAYMLHSYAFMHLCITDHTIREHIEVYTGCKNTDGPTQNGLFDSSLIAHSLYRSASIRLLVVVEQLANNLIITKFSSSECLRSVTD